MYIALNGIIPYVSDLGSFETRNNDGYTIFDIIRKKKIYFPENTGKELNNKFIKDTIDNFNIAFPEGINEDR